MIFRNRRMLVPAGLIVFGLGVLAGNFTHFANVAEAQSPNRVFELRTYTVHPGRLDELHRRFAQQTMQIFKRHGMTNIAYFKPEDAPLAENTLIYILAHDSREAAAASWAAFRADPEWKQIAEETQRDGPMVDHIESVFLDPTDYSPLK
jgi:NIPSNAP